MSFSEETVISTDDSRSPSGNNNPPAWLNTFVRGMSDEQLHDRKQSLDCTAIKVSIPAASTTTKKPGDPPHTVYILHITSGITQWNIRRRYSDFYYIHQILKKYILDEILPQLPPKRYFGSNDSKFIEERRIQLERYIKAVIAIPQTWTRIDIVQFLDNENNTLLFVWNFEKMRKMQDALGKMTWENKNQTEKLSEELKLAKEEVRLLKDRLGQMEMFFLQHATGVASTKLTPTALRTLSGARSNPQELLKLQEENDENEDQISQSVSQEREIVEYDPKIFTTIEADMSSNLDDSHVYKPEEVVEILKLTKLDNTESITKGDQKEEESADDDSHHYVPLSKQRSFIAPNKGKSSDSPTLNPRVVAMSKQLQDAVRLSNELLDDKLQIPSPDKTRLPSSEPRANSTLLNINDNALSPNLPPLPPPVDMEFDESILSEVLTLYPRRCPESLSAEFSSEFQEEAVSKSRATPEWLEKLQSRFDEIIFSLIPTNEQVNERLIVFNYVRTIIHRSLGAHVYPMGSFTTRTFLPGGDVDISAFLTADQLDSWFVKVNEAMCLSSIGTENNSTGYSLPDGTFKRITIRNVSFINAWVKVVKGIVNNVEVDISANQIGALYAQALVDRLDEYVDKLHLFKRSILLIKAWCKYESAKHNSFEGGIFGAREGRLSTWSIVIMIIWIFNKFGREITHPFQVLVGFFCYFTEFDWTKYALTVQGPVSAEDLRPLPVDGIGEFYLLPLCGGYLPNDILDMYKDRFNYAKENSIARRREKYYNSINRSHSASAHDNDDNTSVHSEASRHSEEPESFRSGLSFDYEDDTGRNGGLISYSYYKRGLMNVMDPIQIKHNTTRAVDMNGYKAILESLYNGKKSVVKLCLEMKKYIIDPTSPGTLSFSPSRSSVSSSASSTLLNSPLFRDVPMIRKFMENTLNKLLEIKHSPTSTSMLNITNYHVLDSCPQQIEISLKYGELILASIVTPEALAKLIVSIIETKGPLPVGEIGKILQEMTGNESLSNVLRAQYRGLKKVVEGFHEVFQVGTEHPFNPLVHLHENYLKIRNEWWYDESKSAHLFVFSPDLSSTVGPVPRTRVRDYQGSELSSVSSDSNEKNDQFVALTKSRSFKEQSLYDRGDVKRSGSLSSAPIGIATGMLPNNNAMLASSPSGRNRNKNKNNANPLTSAANPPPRHSKQPQQQSTSNSNPQQQQYLQQQYYQQQYQQQIQYQTFLHQQQYYYTQQQMALLQQQANQNKEAGSSSTDGLETESIQSSSAVLEDSQGNSTNSPPAVPSSVPVNPYVMYSLPLHIPFSNQATSSNNELNGPTSPSHSSLSTSPTATGSFMQAPSGGVTLPMGFYPPLFNPMTQNQNSTPSSPISSQRSLSPTTSSAGPPTMPVIIPAMMKPPPYGLIYGSPPTNGLYGQYGMSPQSIGTFMVPSSLPQASSNSSKNGIDTPPTLPPRGHSS